MNTPVVIGILGASALYLNSQAANRNEIEAIEKGKERDEKKIRAVVRPNINPNTRDQYVSLTKSGMTPQLIRAQEIDFRITSGRDGKPRYEYKINSSTWVFTYRPLY